MDIGNERISFLHFIREEELKHAMNLIELPDDAGILEFGGGDGFLARRLSQKGYKVIAVDIEPRYPQQYPVLKIGSPELPFEENSFDFIFSSNVLEHVTDLSATLSELKRVLKPNGSAIFTMPTPAWRVYSLLEIPIKLLGRYHITAPLYYLDTPLNNQSIISASNPSIIPFIQRIQRAIKYILTPHGKFPTALHEVFSYAPSVWQGKLSRNNLEVQRVVPLPILYANLLFPFRWMLLRTKLANRFLCSCLIYHVKPKR
ncbi:MAG: class I SAM-dependent methyltransferase [Chloroflexota bacterium]